MMKLVILDPDEQKALIKRRQLTGADRYDEVWNGVYVMSPIADNEHQYLVYKLTAAIDQSVPQELSALVYPGVNVTDREENWEQNYRCPDMAVFLPDNPAQDRGTHYFGGPDFAVEIVSRHDRSRKKFNFYRSVGVRELLLVDRRPWRLQLYRLENGAWTLIGVSDPVHSQVLTSEVLSVTFRLIPAERRPRIEVTRTSTGQSWLA